MAHNEVDSDLTEAVHRYSASAGVALEAAERNHASQAGGRQRPSLLVWLCM
jgi:hypothetical protein